MHCITQHMCNTLRSTKHEIECIAFFFYFHYCERKTGEFYNNIREQQCAFK